MITTEQVVRAIISNSQGKVLLVQRAKHPDAGKWSLPGGKVEPNESAKKAIIREIREELSLTFNPQDAFTLTDTQSVPGITCEVTFWQGSSSGEIKPKPDEMSAVRYFSLQDLSAHPIAFNHGEVLEKLLQRSQVAK